MLPAILHHRKCQQAHHQHEGPLSLTAVMIVIQTPLPHHVTGEEIVAGLRYSSIRLKVEDEHEIKSEALVPLLHFRMVLFTELKVRGEGDVYGSDLHVR